MDKKEKTNVMRILDQKKIPYKHYCYADTAAVSGVEVAQVLGQDPAQVFKTLVTESGKGGHFVFVIPVAENLELKKAAAASGNKRIEMVHVRELFDLTGYVRGGCSPIGMKKVYPSYVDETAQLYDEIYFSAGKRGVQIILDPEILAEVSNAEFCDLTK